MMGHLAIKNNIELVCGRFAFPAEVHLEGCETWQNMRGLPTEGCFEGRKVAKAIPRFHFLCSSSGYERCNKPEQNHVMKAASKMLPWRIGSHVARACR